MGGPEEGVRKKRVKFFFAACGGEKGSKRVKKKSPPKAAKIGSENIPPSAAIFFPLPSAAMCYIVEGFSPRLSLLLCMPPVFGPDSFGRYGVCMPRGRARGAARPLGPG